MLFNEPKLLKCADWRADVRQVARFSALQRAEIAEIDTGSGEYSIRVMRVSVLFNEPKLLKSNDRHNEIRVAFRFSALQRAEIAEITVTTASSSLFIEFQCSSTSRNC